MEFESRRKIKDGPNITPLIDVVFILLIFFMLTSTFIEDDGIELNLPSAEASQKLDSDVFSVSIMPGGQIHFKGESITLEVLRDKASDYISSNPSSQVVIRSDSKVEVQELITVMDNLRQVGARNISFATDRSLD